VTRLLPLLSLLAAVALTGCGASSDAVAPAPPAAAAAKPRKVRIVPKRTFVKRVDKICAGFNGQELADSLPTVSSDVARNRAVFGRWFRHARHEVRRMRVRLKHVGQPSRSRARWTRAMAKLHAIERHLDTMGAAASAGSVHMLVLSAHEIERSGKSADRRFRLFGAKRCYS
jgi:hypothetical protein